MARIFLFLISFGFVSLAFATWEKMDLRQFRLPAPPVAQSTIEHAEVEVLLGLQAHRDNDQCKMALAQQYLDYSSFWGFTEILTDAEVRRATHLMERVEKLTEKITHNLKKHHQRHRPYTSYSQIKPCIPRPSKNPTSYPSSHASVAAAQACLFAQKFPERADEILTYGEYLGNLRFIVGVHYPSDVKAGQQLGQEICHVLLRNNDFIKEFMNF